VGAWDWTVRRRGVGGESWSPEESGLKSVEDFGDSSRFNYGKTNSRE